MVELKDVEAAAARISGHVTRTPFLPSQVLSRLVGAQVFIKFENHQFTGSFKDRGAFNKLASLERAQAGAGVCAMSAGNHAQGVAWSAQRLGLAAVIVMPRSTPLTKVENTRALGAEVVLAGDTLEDAAKEAQRIAAERELLFVHPFDDPMIIAGQGTVGLEILQAGVDLDAIVCPVGGGGLISGVATAVKGRAPRVAVYGVQCASHATLVPGAPPPGGVTIADGIAVKTPGDLTSAIIRDRVDDVFAVPEWAIEQAVALYINIEKTVAEGAGAAPLALLLAHGGRFAGKRVGVVLSGGNIDARLLSSLLLRELVRERRIVTLSIEAPDQPGFLAKAAGAIAQTGANVIEVEHRRSLLSLPARAAVIEVTIEARGPDHAEEVLRGLAAAGYAARLVDHPRPA